MLIGKLAMHSDLRGQGFGALLLADALERIVIASHQVAAKVVVVDALSERVAAWYESLGFIRVPGSLVLVQRIVDIAAALEASDRPDDLDELVEWTAGHVELDV